MVKNDILIQDENITPLILERMDFVNKKPMPQSWKLKTMIPMVYILSVFKLNFICVLLQIVNIVRWVKAKSFLKEQFIIL